MIVAGWFRTLTLASLVVLTASTLEVSAQRREEPVREEEALRSDDWKHLQGAFLRLTGAPLSGAGADRSRLLLIALLDRENAVVNGKSERRRRSGLAELAPDERLSEAYLDYYADVIAAIADLADIRSMDVLLDAITTGFMAQGGLISFGRSAVAPVAARTSHLDERVRSSAVFTLNQMIVSVKEVADDPPSRRVITDTLRSAARDDNYLVRARAAEGLVLLGGPDSIAIVKELARTDPYTYPPEYTERQGRYPVREAAAAALTARGIR